MVKRNDTISRWIEACPRHKWETTIQVNPKKGNAFAKTFLHKADLLNLWNTQMVTGYFEGNADYQWVDENLPLLGGIAWTFSKRSPKVMNLQLLHVFAAYRRQGIATELCEYFITVANMVRCDYWRVSSEVEAVPFYRSLGIKFQGIQKSGCYLAIARTGKTFAASDYDLGDEVISKAVNKKGRGGCIRLLFLNP